MVDTYRLKYFGTGQETLAIAWAYDKRGYGREDHPPGDFRVRAIEGRPDIQTAHYSAPMSLAGARAYILQHPEMLGDDVRDCVGLNLEDVIGSFLATADFPEPIQIRNIGKK